jgi:2'-hydroxyisoflavone reductase
MRILVLGGTAWLGRAVAVEARTRGHEVACLARGETGSAPRGLRFARADRDRPDAYESVRGERWDAVVDVARQPGHVRGAVAALEPVAGRYLFVSTGNVYADQRTLRQDEDAPLLPPLESDTMIDMEQYGPAKVACEQAVLARFGPARTVIARSGLIGGPGDSSGRSGYWPWRFANPADLRGVVVPDAADRRVALIDVRDLADWLVRAAETGVAGVFNLGGEELSLGEHLAAAARAAGYDGPLVTAPESILAEHGVQEWMGAKSLPLWLSDPDWWGMNARDTGRAVAAGLQRRPLDDTYRDVLADESARDRPGPHGAGLSDAEERELLDALVP